MSQLQRVAAIVLSLCCAAAAAVAADRIFTTPNPAAELKRLFPNAAALLDAHGRAAALHRVRRRSAKRTRRRRRIGVAFWTTDLVPQEHGYHGPIHILVGMDMTGVLTGVVVTYNSEPYGYFSVEPPKFAMQFKGKKISDPFRVGGDVDAVSRASISIASATRAIRDSARMVAKQLLPEAGK